MITLYNRGEKILDDPFFKFPGGEWHMKLDRDWSGKNIAIVQGADLEDYIKLALWARVIKAGDPEERAIPVGETHAIIPYFPAARSDRGIPTGAELYYDLINLAPLNAVYTFDVHSYFVIDDLEWGTKDTPQLYYSGPWNHNLDHFKDVYHGVIAPDKGAVSRASEFAKKIGVPLIVADKERDFITGNLSRFTCPDLEGDDYLVVDDICDGGGTFNGLADVIKEQNPNVTLDLFVSHGIFSKGFTELHKRYDTIYTTNSLDQSENIRLLNKFGDPHAFSVMNILVPMLQRI